jgi:hypothetical protein
MVPSPVKITKNDILLGVMLASKHTDTEGLSIF